ncbi:hypothetical protein QQP08_011942 [Theobroma cacao]|nr:hypothetical protein QQP08_011942 [Theobroma cacao]
MCAQLNVLQIELEVSHAGFLNESPQISKDHCSDESSHCIRDGVREVPQKVYAECVESDQAVKKEESNALVQAEKTEPSWHIIDKDELASMVTQKSVEHVENCDLPQPLTKDFRKGQLPSLELPGYCETSSLILATIIGEGPPQLSVDENQRMLGDMQHSLPNSESLLSTRPPTILRGKQQL